MHWNRSSPRARATGLWAVLLAVTAAGCNGGYKMPTRPPTTSSFRLTHHVGGTHYRIVNVDGRYVIAFGNGVQIVDPQSLAIIHDLPLAPFGQCGPVIDLLPDGERLWAVVEDDAVVELELPAGRPPTISTTTTSDALGVLPRRLSRVGNSIFVSGPGGVFDLDSRRKVFVNEGDCGSVAQAGQDLVVCIGRRVHRVSDGAYIGAASELVNLGDEVDSGGAATLAYALRSDDNTLGGLMTPNVREIPGGQGTVAMSGAIERLRVFEDRLFLVGPNRIDAHIVQGDSIRPAGSIDILGARDIERLDERTYIVVGTAGRAMYQFDADDSGRGRFLAAEREASRLTYATGDGLNILAGSREGAWMYLVNARAELMQRTLEVAPPGGRVANTIDAQATISTDGASLSVMPAIGSDGVRPWTYEEPKGARLHTIVAIDGDFWLGHDRGITVLRSDGGQGMLDPKLVAKAANDPAIALPTSNPVRERLRLPGPVKYLFPMLAGSGATYVSEFGGFGAAQFVDEVVDVPLTSG